MDTGNKIIILCPAINEKMFPYTETLSCLLPVGNTNTLTILLEEIKEYSAYETLVIGPNNSELKSIAEQYQAEYREIQENYVHQIYDETQQTKQLVILKGDVLWNSKDINKLFDVAKTGKNGAVIKEYDRYTQPMDTLGVQATSTIQSVYAHPREHYVNAQLCGGYTYNQAVKPFMQYCNRGFHNVNCGQMPDTKYYLEEVLQNAIEEGIEFMSIYSQDVNVELKFPWDLAAANKAICHFLNDYLESKVAKDTIIEDTCQIEGYIETGNNVIIKQGVIIEGNCKIGNDVIIEKGAIIGKNCIIGDHTRIGYQCKINDETVIGPNNKIGYHAEMSGVTFDGVCAVHGCEVFGIIGKKVDIAAGVRMAILRFDDSLVTQYNHGKKYRTPFTNYIFIGDYCRTGVNNVFLPGVKVGSRSAIGPSVLVEKDIEENSLILLKQETIVKEWGSSRYGW